MGQTFLDIQCFCRDKDEKNEVKPDIIISRPPSISLSLFLAVSVSVSFLFPSLSISLPFFLLSLYTVPNL